MGCWPISSRLITIRLRAKPFNIILGICTNIRLQRRRHRRLLWTVTGSSGPNSRERKTSLWYKVTRMQGWEKMHIRIGKVRVGNTVSRSNERGLRLLEFASNNNLILANRFGPQKLSRRVTWHSPIGEHHNQIDYIMVKRCFRSSINIAKTRNFPGADIASDHEIVIMTFISHLKRVKKQGSNLTLRNWRTLQ